MALAQITDALGDEFLAEGGLTSVGRRADLEKFAAHLFASWHIDAAIDYEK
jgi:hypothetical protein